MPILRLITGLQFAENNQKYNSVTFFMFAIPVATIILLIINFRAKNRKTNIFTNAILSVTLIFVSIIVTFFAYPGTSCTILNGKQLFKSQANKNEFIYRKPFGCSFMNSNPENPKIYKVYKIGEYFIRESQIDTSKIDKTTWIRTN